MKTISAELQAHLESDDLSIATCWKLTRTDNTIMGFTDHDKDHVISSVTYEASTGFTPTAVKGNSSMSSDNLDVNGMLDSASISEDDIMAGLYDFAEIEIFQVNHQDLTQGALMLRKGWLGEVSMRNNQFSAEVRGVTDSYNQTIGELYSPSCRAVLGDARCKVALAGFTVTGTITTVTSNRIIEDSTRTEASGWFSGGEITFTSGANNGLKMEVKEYVVGSDIVLVLPMPYDIQIGDSYSMIAGCDKTLGACKDKFSNILNFRGEPTVPGTDKILKTSSTS
jgi:uncharacterized phage protein (TIGR02218 family)